MKKAVILLAEGFEEVEALTPIDLLRRAGIETQIASVDGTDIVMGSHAIGVKCDVSLSDVNLSEMDLLILPGGKLGTENLDQSEEVRRAVCDLYERKQYIAAICAAPSVFGHLGLLKGRRATCYPGFETELTGAECTTENVVVDGHVITSRGLGTAIDFGLKLAELLVGQEMSEKLAKGIVYAK